MAAIAQMKTLVEDRLNALNPSLRKINTKIHSTPELAYHEFSAHDTLTSFLESQGLPGILRQAHGIDTAFDVSVGSGGRQVIICCEYDALPDIGHGCGHNLIATASLAAFLGAAHALTELGVPGRVRILGTPAEEGGGGKARLIKAGAFDPREDIAASIMAHPFAAGVMGVKQQQQEYHGVAGYGMIASNKFRVEFRGATAHAAGEPWNGVNALDAAVSAYTNVSLLRQQIRPDERIHGVIEAGGTVPNVIPDYTRMNWYVRSPTSARADQLEKRVKACIESAAHATGCTHSYIPSDAYMSVLPNATLCKVYTQDMAAFGQTVLEKMSMSEPMTASTDMGNVTHIVPGFHGAFLINTKEGVTLHSRGFAEAAATDEAHEAAIKCGKGMAMLALRVITDDAVAKAARDDFERRYE